MSRLEKPWIVHIATFEYHAPDSNATILRGMLYGGSDQVDGSWVYTNRIRKVDFALGQATAEENIHSLGELYAAYFEFARTQDLVLFRRIARFAAEVKV